MKYISTRGGDSADNFKEVVMKGLAADGGLFVPVEYPKFSAEKIQSFKDLSYAELAFEVISPFIGDSVGGDALKKILSEVYSADIFRSPEIAPTKHLYDNYYLLELFHGPTLAFKDFALQLLGRFFDHFLAGTDQKINILGATSGDTGSAAIAGCAGRDSVNIFILHPYQKVSEVQRRQMTTVISDNVFNIALEGSFDDCQNIVKELFADLEFKQSHTLSAVNSINWGRIVAQIVYYFYSALQFDDYADNPVSFSVPTGNFGDILAGWIAMQMGLPVNKLIIATNKNDILHRFMESGEYKKQAVYHTNSPSMDIQISSNFERLLFEYHNRDAGLISKKISELKLNGGFSVKNEVLQDISRIFTSAHANDEVTLDVIKEVYSNCGEVLDPHTAIGVHAAKECGSGERVVTLATAHPAKFPDAIDEAVSIEPQLPSHLSDLFNKEEKYDVISNSSAEIKSYILDQA